MPTRHVMAVLFASAILLAIGCTAPSQSAFRGLSQPDARALARKMAESRQHELDEDLRSAFTVRSPRNVLLLSGGDQDVTIGFDPARMKILYQAGLAVGEKAGAWNEGLPALDGDPGIAGGAPNFR